MSLGFRKHLLVALFDALGYIDDLLCFRQLYLGHGLVPNVRVLGIELLDHHPSRLCVGKISYPSSMVKLAGVNKPLLPLRLLGRVIRLYHTPILHLLLDIPENAIFPLVLHGKSDQLVIKHFVRLVICGWYWDARSPAAVHCFAALGLELRLDAVVVAVFSPDDLNLFFAYRSPIPIRVLNHLEKDHLIFLLIKLLLEHLSINTFLLITEVDTLHSLIEPIFSLGEMLVSHLLALVGNCLSNDVDVALVQVEML